MYDHKKSKKHTKITWFVRWDWVENESWAMVVQGTTNNEIEPKSEKLRKAYMSVQLFNLCLPGGMSKAATNIGKDLPDPAGKQESTWLFSPDSSSATTSA